MYVILQILHETALVETFNLKAAIEYQLKNCTLLQLVIISASIFITYMCITFTDEAAQEALTDMPPRSEEVHSSAIIIVLLII